MNEDFLPKFSWTLLCYSGQQAFSAPGFPSLLRPSVEPTFPPLTTSLPSASAPTGSLPLGSVAGPQAEWQFHRPPRMPNQLKQPFIPLQQFERRQHIVPQSRFERPQQVIPSVITQPPLPVAVPARTLPSSIVHSPQVTSDGCVVRSASDEINLPQPSSDGNATGVSLDDELMSWLSDIASDPDSHAAADVDFSWILDDVDSSAAAAAACAADVGVASAATAHPPPAEVTISEQYYNLLSQIEQLNELGKQT